MKKIISILLALLLVAALCGCGNSAPAASPTNLQPAVPAPVAEPAAAASQSNAQPAESAPAAAASADPETAAEYLFTDDCGREVTLPAGIERIAPSGNVATMILTTVAADKLVCAGAKINGPQIPYLGEAVAALPVTGQLYGGKSTLNLEELLACDPQVIVDLGDYKPGLEDDLDALQAQTGLPVVFLQADFAHMADAFRQLGVLLPDRAARCGELADYLDETLALAEKNRALIPEGARLSVAYTQGDAGLSTNAKGSSQAQVLELVGAENAVEVADVSSKSGGNEINMEQLFLFDPDVVIFGPGSVYADVGTDSTWLQLRAIASGAYYEVPETPYCWLGVPPSLNMVLGIRWLGNLIYPEIWDCDVVAETQRAFSILWDYDLSDTEAQSLLANSTLR